MEPAKSLILICDCYYFCCYFIIVMSFNSFID